MAQHENARERVDNVNVVNPTGDFTPAYRKSDVERIFHEAKPHSWHDLVQFIEQKGDAQWHITPGEAMAMKDDFRHLAQSNVPFTDNPDEAFQEVQKFRGQDRSKEEKDLRQQRR
jgi:hypothetical protein